MRPAAASLGPLVQSFFVDHLQAVKALRPSSIQSYRDGLRLYLLFLAERARCRLTRLTVSDLSVESVVAFLRHLEVDRGNAPRTRNQRLAVLHSFFEYIATRDPEFLAVAERVARVPTKRALLSEPAHLSRRDVEQLIAGLPTRGRHARRDRVLLLFLYNTGARVQEVADLRVRDLDLDARRVRLHGKGDKWRTCPLWTRTADGLRQLLSEDGATTSPEMPVFRSQQGGGLTRFGLYKVVRRHCQRLDDTFAGGRPRHVSPHVFRHTTAVHLLEAGVEINVIRGWLGHVSLTTTHRYAEIGIEAKRRALEKCLPPTSDGGGFPDKPAWRNDEALLEWLASL